jgi:hypothetical protein
VLVQAINIINEFNPKAAQRLLKQLYPDDPDDGIDDAFGGAQASDDA